MFFILAAMVTGIMIGGFAGYSIGVEAGHREGFEDAEKALSSHRKSKLFQ